MGVYSIMGSVVKYLSILKGVEVVFYPRQTCFPRCTCDAHGFFHDAQHNARIV